MENKSTGFYRIDCKDDSDLDFENYFYMAAYHGIEEQFPDEKILTEAVSIGTVYRNRYHISCQIKFNGNDIICQCNYDIEKRISTIKIYRLKETYCYIKANIEDRDDNPNYIFFKKNEYKGVN